VPNRYHVSVALIRLCVAAVNFAAVVLPLKKNARLRDGIDSNRASIRP